MEREPEPPKGVRGRIRARGVALQADTPLAATVRAGTSGSQATGPNSGPGRSDDGNGNAGNARDSEKSEQGPRRPREAIFDTIRPDVDFGIPKQGNAGQPLPLTTNYFRTRTKAQDWRLFQYDVKFSPDLEHTLEKKRLLRPYAGPGDDKLGSFIFDGSSLWTTSPIQRNMLEISTVYQNNSVVIGIRLVAQVPPGDVMYLQFYNILMRKCLQALGLILMGRNYFDSSIAVTMPDDRLEVWRGYAATLRQHDAGLLYCVEVTHKVLRMDTVWEVMKRIRWEHERNGMEAVKNAIVNEVVGSIVMTTYNSKRRTYKIDGMVWSANPTNTFQQRNGEQISFINYYKTKYNVEDIFEKQPLMMSRPKDSDIRRGMTQPFLLVPELCRMTGTNERMKADWELMRRVNRYQFLTPDEKLDATVQFVQRLRANPEVRSELDGWGVEVGTCPLTVPGRYLKKETILFKNPGAGPSVPFEVNEKGDFTSAFRNQRMITSAQLKTWVIIVPAREEAHMSSLVRMLQSVATPMGFIIPNAKQTLAIGNPDPQDFAVALEKARNTHKDLQMVLVILPNNKIDAYATVKKRCYVDYGLPSQCMLAKNLVVKANSLKSIATKMVVQMNAKLGGEPWNIINPLKTLMVIGFDVYHGGSNKDKSIGAMISTTTPTLGSYYSCVSFFDRNNNELSTTMAKDVEKCCHAYQKKNNGALPQRIIFYRDGVGFGQLHQVFHSEVQTIANHLTDIYDGRDPVKFSFIVVSKRINTRLFLPVQGGYDNPPPGSIVDNSITLPERWDFFLISQVARQGVVSPTNYNVIYDRQGLPADKIQIITYRLCHLYYNWSGTVAVPSVCQYAHKLAYLTGLATQAQNNPALAHWLYFL